MDYTDVLRRLAINDSQVATDDSELTGAEPHEIDPKALALVRLAALISIGGAPPSYGAHVDTLVATGATSTEMVDVLVGLIPVIGLPRVVAAAPKLAMALGYDIDDALER